MKDRTVSGLKRIVLLAVFVVLCALICGVAVTMTGCGDDVDERLMLHLSFDEGKGTTVHDKAGKVKDGKVQYVFNNPQYQDEALAPEWRKNGVSGGCLLFDGYSNYIRYNYSDIKVRGQKFSVSAYVAPRAFEWDDPQARDKGTDNLTAIVAQSFKAEGQGFILGYQRHGSWSFQVGIGDRWISVWDDNMPLEKYKWNHVVATFDGAKGVMRLYLNGEKAGEKTFFEGSSIDAAVDEPLYIAKNNDHPYSNATASGNMVSGLIDELKLYKAVLSESEIKSMYGKHKLKDIKFEDIWLQNILTEDYYKTQLHGGPYQHWMNEPHAPMYYNGKYHLFFQFNPVGPYFHNICWGHLVSDDMVNWKPIKEVITPTAGTVAPDGVWSGGVTYDKNGVPLLFFTAGNDSFKSDGLISNQNVGVAYPKDITDPELTEWVVCDELAIKQKAGEGRTGEFRDMHIWQEGSTWCMLIGTGATSGGGTAILYTATTLECKFDGTVAMNWQYKGPVYQMTSQPSNLGKVWELPVILPVKNEAGTTKYVFFISPAPADSADNKIYYFLGDFNLTTGKFTPDAKFNNKPALLDYSCNVFTGPSGFIDPVSKNAYVFSIMQDQRAPSEVAASGWANCVGFARKVALNAAGDDITVSAVEALANYDMDALVDLISPKTVAEANAALKGVGTDMMHIRVKFGNTDATSFGIRIKMGSNGTDLTSYTYDVESKTIIGATQNKGQNAQSSRMPGDLTIQNGTLIMDIYIDRSLVEAFFNNDKALTIRSYADFASTGIELFADGGSVTVEELYVAPMKSIYK